LLEQSHVLDRDHRLVGEGGDQLDLLVGKRPHLGATNHENANGLVLPQQGSGENGPEAEAARACAAIPEPPRPGPPVLHVHPFPTEEGPPSHPATPYRRIDKIHWDRAVMSSDTEPFTLT